MTRGLPGHRADGRDAYFAHYRAANRERLRRESRERCAANRAEWIQKNGPCVDCGSWDSLEIDHVDPKDKVSHRIWTWSPARREAELKKCAPRCTTCHRKKTWTLDYPKADHGSYVYRSGCRCEICRAANATIQRRHVARIREGEISLQRPGRKHGEWLYNAGCRCEICVITKRDGQRRRALRRKAVAR